MQAVGASAEFGNVQGAVINVITRQGSERFLFDTSYYSQPESFTSQPVTIKYDGGRRESGYERSRYRDFTSNLGGPVVRNRLWFFGGYQYLRDYDSQPGTDPAWPRTYEQNKLFGKLTWRLAPAWQLNQSFHHEYWVSPDQPRVERPIETTNRHNATVPAMTFGHLTHTASARTVWDIRVGRFVYSQESPPTSGNRAAVNRVDALTSIMSGGPPSFSELTLIRTTVKSTINHYRPAWWGADHAWKAGVQIERGEHYSPLVIPTGVHYTDRNGPFSATYANPSNTGGVFITTGAFVTDAITVGRSAHDQRRSSLRSQPRHQRGTSRRGSPGQHDSDHLSRRRNTLHVEHPLAATRAHHEADSGRADDAAWQLRTIQSGRPDRRACRFPPRRLDHHDQGLGGGCRRLHTSDECRRPKSAAPQPGHARASYRRVRDWHRPRTRPAAPDRDGLRAKVGRELHRMGGRGRAFTQPRRHGCLRTGAPCSSTSARTPPPTSAFC